MPDLQKPFYALQFLFALALIGWGASTAGAPGAAFGLFAFMTIGGSLMCVWERSVVRSAFALLSTFCGVAGLFILLGADFVGMAQILIYVGGILALLLFGVMLSPPDMTERSLPRLFSALLLMGGAVLWVAVKVNSTVSWATAPGELPERGNHVKEIGVGFLAPDGYVVAFELAAVLLTVALVAAVYIARRRVSDLQERKEDA
jgi:NADH:ubiquinone oxidoreductase subunit 6 (subunit J)